MSIAGVEWDKGNGAKCQKHGLSLRDIEYILLQGIKYVLRDERNSLTEGRYIAIGRTKAMPLLPLRFAPPPTAGYGCGR